MGSVIGVLFALVGTLNDIVKAVMNFVCVLVEYADKPEAVVDFVGVPVDAAKKVVLHWFSTVKKFANTSTRAVSYVPMSLKTHVII